MIDAGEFHVIVVVPLAIVRVKLAEPVHPSLVVAAAVKVNRPAAVGVPARAPFPARVRPGGRLPALENMWAPTPPLALIAAAYGTPTCPSGTGPLTTIGAQTTLNGVAAVLEEYVRPSLNTADIVCDPIPNAAAGTVTTDWPLTTGTDTETPAPSANCTNPDVTGVEALTVAANVTSWSTGAGLGVATTVVVVVAASTKKATTGS